LLKGLIDDWRRQFGSETQFLIVQLPGYGAAGTAPQDSAWAQLREQQRLVAETVPSTGLAVTIDLGDRFNLHPVVKQEVGRRLALLAEEMIRGTATTSLGPAPVSAVRTGKAVVVKFKNTARGLMTYGAARPIGFELCDGARRCRYADASVESDRVEIVLVNSKDAEFLRFCWADSPVCNLYNSEGLPAVPFEMPITRMVRGHKQ
jgi:sialate O-acetylesterase